MKKRFLALALASVMVFSLAACSSKENATTPTQEPQTTDAPETTKEAEEPQGEAETTPEATEEANAQEVVNREPSGQIIIGESSEKSGDITPFWSNGASDYAAYKLVTGSEPSVITKDESYIYNERVVSDVQETENEDGSKTWTFTLNPDLKWSNGEPMTAKDYVFHYLFWTSPEVIVDLKASEAIIVGQYVKGFDDYSTGKTKTFEGVHLLGEDKFSVTIDAKNLPYFYGKSLVSQEPSYMAGWVPSDITIEETDKGAKFSDNFTAKYIKDTVEKERYSPTASSGAYYMEKYDKSGYSYILKVNPYYPGNFEGKKANIETVVYKYVTQNTMMDEIKTGAIDLLLMCADGKEIDAGLDMVEAGTHKYISYPRNGYGRLIFKCDEGPSQFVEVRQAVAYLLDRNEFAKTFTGGHGTIVHGPYGTNQWMVEEAEDKISELNTYNKDVNKAIEVLEKGGWTLDKDGNEYKGEGLRYKEVDGKLMPLKLQWCSSENNSVSDLLVSMLSSSEDVKKAGMEIVQNVVTFQVLLDAYYNDTGDYDMFNMGEGFSVPYDIKQYYENGSPSNYNRITDDELSKYAVEMNRVEEGDDETYLETWFKFIKRWNELVPDIPLYSNEYHDFYLDRVKGYDFKNDIWDASKAILYAYVED